MLTPMLTIVPRKPIEDGLAADAEKYLKDSSKNKQLHRRAVFKTPFCASTELVARKALSTVKASSSMFYAFFLTRSSP